MSNNGDGFSSDNIVKYAANDRLTNRLATYKCLNIENDLFTTPSATIGNKAATYPIGLITVDELMYSGLVSKHINKLTFTYANFNYWTMSPTNYNTKAAVFQMYSGGYPYFSYSYNKNALRPVINLKSDVKISGGVGTSENPFVVETA